MGREAGKVVHFPKFKGFKGVGPRQLLDTTEIVPMPTTVSS